MSTTPTTGRQAVDTRDTSRTGLRTATIGATIALVANVAIWAGGAAADVTFSVTTAGSDTSSEVGVGLVALGTLGGFYAGWALFAWAARRSASWARAVLLTAALVALCSVAGPLTSADDTETGVLLASMHLATGAVFVAVAGRASLSRGGQHDD